VTGLLGPNGAGKTTTVRAVCGIITPSDGTIRVNGVDVHRDPQRAKAQIGYVPESPEVFSSLTGREYLALSGRLYHMPESLATRATELLERFGLLEAADDQLSTYSKGMRQKTVIAAAILHNPSVLILDEPLGGLDASSAAVLKELIRSFADRGRTVLFCSHVLEVVQRLCDDIAILHEGRLLSAGTATGIIEQGGYATLEEAFIALTGETDIEKEAREIVDALE
jgi:ABC-2 type transport system ATP-binding protein